MTESIDAKARPLAGVSIVVTRAGHQSARLSVKLVELGARVMEAPMIEILPPPSWRNVDLVIENINLYDWMIFASANAVDFFVGRWAEKASDKLFTGKIAAIGSVTADALTRKKLAASFQPSQSTTQTLVDEFPGYPHLKGIKILWPRTNIVGRDVIVEKLLVAGAQVDVVECYQTELPNITSSAITTLLQAVADGSLDIITVANSQSVRNLAKILQESFSISNNLDQESLQQSMRQLLRRTAIISIGPQTTATAVELLGKCEGQAQQFNIDGLVEAILNYVSANASQ